MRIFALLLSVALLNCFGCTGTKTPQDSETEPVVDLSPLSLIIVDDANLAETISREWAAQSEQQLTVTQLTTEELWQQDRLNADAVVYPPRYMGELIKRGWIEPIPESVQDNEALAITDFFSSIGKQEIRFDNQLYAVPFGSPSLVLMYREDLLKQLNLDPPTTWEEYQDCVEKINSSELVGNTDSDLASATLEPLTEEYLPYLFLARAAAYAKHADTLAVQFNYATMNSALKNESFIKAASELREVQKTIPNELQALSPSEVGDAMLSGKAAMALGWFSPSQERDLEKVELHLKVASVPGSKTTYISFDKQWKQNEDGASRTVPLISSRGRVGSISTRAANTRNAALLLIRLTSSELGFGFSKSSNNTAMYRSSWVPLTGSWLDRRFDKDLSSNYGAVVQSQLTEKQSINALKIPGQDRYMEILTTSLQEVLSETKEPETALNEAAAEWDQLTEEIGRDQQKRAFNRSLGF